MLGILHSRRIHFWSGVGSLEVRWKNLFMLYGDVTWRLYGIEHRAPIVLIRAKKSPSRDRSQRLTNKDDLNNQCCYLQRMTLSWESSWN